MSLHWLYGRAADGDGLLSSHDQMSVPGVTGQRSHGDWGLKHRRPQPSLTGSEESWGGGCQPNRAQCPSSGPIEEEKHWAESHDGGCRHGELGIGETALTNQNKSRLEANQSEVETILRLIVTIKTIGPIPVPVLHKRNTL